MTVKAEGSKSDGSSKVDGESPLVSGQLRRADEVFSQTLALAEGERSAFIESECGTDVGLRREVDALLSAAADSESYFGDKPARLLGRVMEHVSQHGPAASLEGTDLGPYRLGARIARGGMSSVYRADRADGRYETEVAVKVLRRGLDTEDVVRRFEAERRILAGLDHANIARILDAGEAPDGRPYLVMELVEGRPIIEYCDVHQATVDSRLALFREVCDAVGYAHRHLIIHRDLKSNNILVADGDGGREKGDTGAENGTVKLLDFGIAKLIDPAGDAQTSRLTRGGVRLLTPQFASPEQIAGEAVTTASDVYQLGVLLYQLLVGRSPYDTAAGTPLEGSALEDAIRSIDPMPPSQGISEAAATARQSDPSSLARVVTGDLDAIVLKALRKEPLSRYESVWALSADIEAYCLGLPVGASAGSRMYRGKKFVHRHRYSVSAALGATLLLSTWTATASLQNRALAAERDRVQEEVIRTTAIRDYLVGMFEVADPYLAGPFAGDSTSARELLRAGAARLNYELANQPHAKAEIAFTIGKTYRALSLEDEAKVLLEDALAQQLDLEGPQGRSVARTLHELGLLYGTIDGDSASALLQHALTVGQSAFGPRHAFVAGVLTDLGNQLSFTTSPDTLRSTQLREEAVVLLRSIPDAPRAQLADALTISTYGLNDQMDLVIDRMTEALEIRRELYGDKHPAVASSFNDLSLALEATEPVRADSLIGAALDIYLETLGEAHSVTHDVMGNRAAAYRDIQKDYDAAEALYLRTVELVEEHRPAEDLLARVYPLYGLSTTLMAAKRFEEAEPFLQRTHSILVDAVGWQHGLSFLTRTSLAQCLRELGRLSSAAALLESSREGFAETPWLRVGARLSVLRELKLVYDAQDKRTLAGVIDAEILELKAKP